MTDPDKENLLIDLSTCDDNNILLSNPFDVVALEAENYDPFEMVFNSVYCAQSNGTAVNVKGSIISQCKDSDGRNDNIEKKVDNFLDLSRDRCNFNRDVNKVCLDSPNHHKTDKEVIHKDKLPNVENHNAIIQSEPYDPFQMVFQSAYFTPNRNVTSINTNEIKLKELQGGDTDCSSKSLIPLIGIECSQEQGISSDEHEVRSDKDLRNKDNEIISIKNNRDTAINTEVIDGSGSQKPSSHNILEHAENLSISSLSSIDFTNDVSIRASVQNRINKLMKNRSIEIGKLENVKSQSFNSVVNNSRSVFDKNQYLFFGIDQMKNNKTKPVKYSSLNSLPTKTSLGDTSPPVLFDCSPTAGDVEHSKGLNRGFLCSGNSKNADNSDDVNCKELDISFGEVDDDVFVEANKVAEHFAEMLIHKNQNVNSDQIPLKDENFDLLACKINWDPVDSSDEEAELLRNDPALNLQFHSQSLEIAVTPKKPVEFSDAVMKYIKRRSVDLNSSSTSLTTETPVSSDVGQLKRSHSFNGMDAAANNSIKRTMNSKNPLAIVTDELLKQQPEIVPIVQEENFSQKLKALKPQNVAGSKKKGPMRAVIPVQNMTRSTKVFKKSGSPRASSRSSPQSNCSTPKRKNQRKLSKPVASSTPNKGVSPKVSPALSPILPLQESGFMNRQRQLRSHSFDSSKFETSDLVCSKRIREDSNNLLSNENIKKSEKPLNTSEELKKNNAMRSSQLPRMKSMPALNSRNGNQKIVSLLPQRLNVGEINKLAFNPPSKLRSLSASANKENVLPSELSREIL